MCCDLKVKGSQKLGWEGSARVPLVCTDAAQGQLNLLSFLAEKE